METLNNCPICNNSKLIHFLDCNDFTVSRETFKIYTCENCGFKLTNPRPEAEQIGKYYESDDYISHSNSKRGLLNSLYQFVRNYTIKSKVKLVSESTGNLKHQTLNLLDIGCGTGEFLFACSKSGWNCRGIEPGKKAREYARTIYGLDVAEESAIKTLPDSLYDAITLWHVLEHVHQLNERIKELKRLIKESGTIFIAVPNCLSYDAERYREYWAAYDVPRHLYHFTPNTMTQLLANHGLSIEKIVPMKFDSYYVSLLSEKYKYRSSNYLRAFLNGWRSNRIARKNPNRYSSLIYIVKNS